MESRLNVVLAERRVPKKSVAERLGVSQQTLWRWSTDDGIARMSLATLEELARAIGCEPWDLVRFGAERG